jgi:hypothetical protein
MTRLLTQGDLIRIPQGVELYREYATQGVLFNKTIGLVKETDKQVYGIYNKKLEHLHDIVEVLIEGSSFLVKEEDVYKGDSYVD